MIQVYVDDATAQVTQVWTGYQVAWTMARGYPGAFGRRVNALYVWLPLCLLFVAPFLPWRGLAWRPARQRAWSLLHLDLLVLLGFSISLAFFNHATSACRSPSDLPVHALPARADAAARRSAGAGRASRCASCVPVSWLAVGLVFLVGFRIGLNVINSNVIDVGYAGVIGAEQDPARPAAVRRTGPPTTPAATPTAPFTYYAYVPFRLIFGWSGTWDNLPAAHAAAIAFDLLTMLGLFCSGRRCGGRRSGSCSPTRGRRTRSRC